MTFYYQEIQLETVSGRPSYHMITDEVKQIVADSQVQNGLCLVQTVHTTCSIILMSTCMTATIMMMIFFKWILIMF